MSLSATQYRSLNMVDKRTKCIVYGYINQIERLFQFSTNIPISIIQICILFYFEKECFEKSSDFIKIYGDQQELITKIKSNGWSCVAFGSKWIESNRLNIIKWTVKIIETVDGNGIIVGIVSNDDVDMNRTIYNNKASFPAYFFVHATDVCIEGKWKPGKYQKQYGAKGSVLTMELNLKKQQLIFYVDGECTLWCSC